MRRVGGGGGCCSPLGVSIKKMVIFGQETSNRPIRANETGRVRYCIQYKHAMRYSQLPWMYLILRKQSSF